MKAKTASSFSFFGNSILGSYSQVFFSTNFWLAGLVLLASFSDPETGLSGVLAVIFSILFAKWMGFNPSLIRNGTYSYNSLLVGLTMGVFFKLGLPFLVLLILASCFTVLLTVWLLALTTPYRVPFLSIPFVLGAWVMLLSARSFAALQLSERGIYTFNELSHFGGPGLVTLYLKMNSWALPFLAKVYFKSLGAVFFQYNLLAGILIAAGLLAYSRIAFSLSVLGFLGGYSFCYFVQGNLSELDYSYIGFNYILSAIALGGFFLVPSPRSYLLAVFSAPLIALFIAALGKITGTWQLPLYSLPFSLVVVLLLFALNNRFSPGKLNLVAYQNYSPEENLYAYLHGTERFRKDTYFHIHLPFYGEWRVSQGHAGKITHREDWKYAWDFVVTDETGKTFKLPGKEPSDFFCYNLPVLAPAAGYVVCLLDGVEDNAVGDVNLEENWGNSLVIKHADYLYSQISHIRKGSFRVKIGDYVSKGDYLATCGNSGRSPEPHMHFQLQALAQIGAPTIPYPIAYYAGKEPTGFSFHSFDYPKENQQILPPRATPLIGAAFHFTPGMVLAFEENRNGKQSAGKWEVFVDAANMSYLYCRQTKSLAYFSNNGSLHYFTSFKGDRNSLLYYFFLGAYKILLSYFQDMEVHDFLPVEGFHGGLSKVVQDFVAPFYMYLSADYSSRFKTIDDVQNAGLICIASSATARAGKRVLRQLDFEMDLSANKVLRFRVNEKELCIIAQFIS